VVHWFVRDHVAGGLAGPLPFVAQRRQWLREVQRIPVRIELDRQTDIPALRVGSRANVVVLTQGAGIVAAIGQAWLRIVSVTDYVF
jgi:multidrug resistance efflux pump